MDNQQNLAEKVRAAFSDMRKPKDNKVRRDNDELPEIIGKKWEEVSVEDINKCSTLAFFTREGLRNYLPAYLIAATVYSDEIGCPMLIIYALTPSSDANWTDQMFADFTSQQKSVIREFFEMYDMLYPVSDSMVNHRVVLEEQKWISRGKSYWQQYG
jgi:hypothetical protein